MHNEQNGHYENVIRASSIAEAFWTRCSQDPDAHLYKYAVAPSATGTRVWRSETYASVAPSIARIAAYLKSIGVGVGTPVAIVSHTRPEWALVDIAIQSLGAVTVSIYQSLPWHEVGYILYDSKAAIVVIENEEQAQKIQQLRTTPCPIPERESFPASDELLHITHVISFEKLDTDVGAVLLDQLVQDEQLSSSPPPLPAVTRESISSIVYTSGTTGPPKGVPQTNGNHLTNVRQAAESGVFVLDGSLFLYLPLAHSFARLAYYIGFLSSATLIFPAVVDHKTSKVDLASVARDIREGAASVIPSVPRLFEKMAAAIQARAAGRGLQQKILALCIRNAQAVYAARQNGRAPGILQRIVYDGLAPVREKVKAQLFGTAFSHGISGGAKLDPTVNRFFDALGILVCEGYGLTETCVATHVNVPTRRKIGTVGTALKDVEVRIAPEDGEILLRGPNVTRGYLNRPQATAESWDADGWFRTGDIGALDAEGFLSITDRKKELIVTAGGKKIAPQGIEALFKRYPFISQAFLFGEGKPYCIMLFTINDLETRSMLSEQGVSLTPDTKLSQVDALRKLVAQAVDRANSELSSYETIKRYTILDEDFTIENGLLTPTLKMKRKSIRAQHLALIESLYL
jgi:long-chain acyl-CoA synthetase